MPKNLLAPNDFSCLVSGMDSARVHLVMKTQTYQDLINRLGSLGGAAGLEPQGALHGIRIEYDQAVKLHEVLLKFQTPHISPSITVTLDL